MSKSPITLSRDGWEELRATVDMILLRQLYHITSHQIIPEAVIVKDLGADSLDSQLVIFALEDRFDIEIDEKEIDESLTVADVYDLVAKKLTETEK